MAKPFIFILDDDPVFSRVMDLVLGKLGFQAKCFSQEEDLFRAIEQSPPSLCLVDLNLNSKRSGLAVIEAIRAKDSFPIFVISSTSETQTIAHALEIGADDYIIKPVSRELLVSKLRNFVSSEALSMAGSAHSLVTQWEAPALVEFDAELLEIDELGVRILSRHLIPKGAVIYFGADIFKEITGSSKPLLLTACDSAIDVDTQQYLCSLEFDGTGDEFLTKLRTWLIKAKPLSSGMSEPRRQ